MFILRLALEANRNPNVLLNEIKSIFKCRCRRSEATEGSVNLRLEIFDTCEASSLGKGLGYRFPNRFSDRNHLVERIETHSSSAKTNSHSRFTHIQCRKPWDLVFECASLSRLFESDCHHFALPTFPFNLPASRILVNHC